MERGGIESGKKYAILTDELTKAWSGKTTREYKTYKSLTKENLRDNMTDIELNLNSLAELTTKALAKKLHPQGLVENREVANKGGTVAKNAKEDFENVTGINVVSNVNAKNLNASNNSKIDKDE